MARPTPDNTASRTPSAARLRDGARFQLPTPPQRHDAGRIINPRTARSQVIGGIIWGIGRALLEQSETDPRTGRFLHCNYSGYLVPTNADIPDLDVVFSESLIPKRARSAQRG